MKLSVSIEGDEGFPVEIVEELWERMEESLKDLVFSANIGSVLDSVHQQEISATKRAHNLNAEGRLTDVINPIGSNIYYVMVNTLQLELIGRPR